MRRIFFLISRRDFFTAGDLFLFFTWGRVTIVGGGGNNAFMAEPSDRPAINDSLSGRKKRWVCKYEKKKKGGKKKKLNLFFQPGQNFSAQLGEVTQ